MDSFCPNIICREVRQKPWMIRCVTLFTTQQPLKLDAYYSVVGMRFPGGRAEQLLILSVENRDLECLKHRHLHHHLRGTTFNHSCLQPAGHQLLLVLPVLVPLDNHPLIEPSSRYHLRKDTTNRLVNNPNHQDSARLVPYHCRLFS